MSLVLNNIVIESRESDNFINATQLCKAGGKSFREWNRLDSTKELIKELEKNLHVGYPTCKKQLIETSRSKYKGSWIHPDLAVPLAQWISPAFAIQVSRWIRELFITGNVSIDSNKSDEELKILQEEISRLRLENKEHIDLLDEKEQQLNRLHNIQKELLSYKKRVEKNEIVYIVSTANYARQGIFKVGRTKNKMSFRSSSHNTTHVKGDKVKVLREFKVNDSVLVERNIHTKLTGLLLEGEREFFMCPYDLLENLVDLIVNNDDEENEMVNRIIDTVFKLKRATFNSQDWMSGISEDVFRETLAITNGSETLQVMDVSNWTEQHKKDFISHCVQEYIKQQDKVDEEYQMLWKAFQVFLMEQLSVPKSHFKATTWKPIVKEEIEKKKKLTIKWRS